MSPRIAACAVVPGKRRSGAAFWETSGVREWSGCSEAERQVLTLASEEGMLWEVCAFLEPDPARRGTAVIAAAQDVVGRLAQEGLLWFFRLTIGTDSPDLTDAEVESLFGQSTAWTRDDQGEVASVAMHLTSEGERLYYPS
jgi:hypothetical protein